MRGNGVKVLLCENNLQRTTERYVLSFIMKTIIYSTHKFEKDVLIASNNGKHELKFVDIALSLDSTYVAAGAEAVSIFVNDDASEKVLEALHAAGVNFLVLRSAGFSDTTIQNLDCFEANLPCKNEL